RERVFTVRHPLAGRGDEQLVQLRPSEGAGGDLARGNLVHLLEAAVGRVPVYGALVGDGGPHAASGVDGQAVRAAAVRNLGEGAPTRQPGLGVVVEHADSVRRGVVVVDVGAV